MWQVGAKLYIEKGIERWCSSQSCAGGQTSGIQEPIQPKVAPASAQQQAPAPTGVEGYMHESQVHDALWKMAGQKVAAVDHSDILDDRDRVRSKHILHQSIYYGLVAIHTGKSPKR